MSQLRNTTPAPGKFAPTGADAYYAIYNSVKGQKGLIHGRLHKNGEHCAIGSFFAAEPNIALYDEVIDEVATINDSRPKANKLQRKQIVLKWLKWKLGRLGMKV